MNMIHKKNEHDFISSFSQQRLVPEWRQEQRRTCICFCGPRDTQTMARRKDHVLRIQWGSTARTDRQSFTEHLSVTLDSYSTVWSHLFCLRERQLAI